MRAYDTTEPITLFLKNGTRILIRGNRALVSLRTEELSSIRALLVPAEHEPALSERSRDSEVTASRATPVSSLISRSLP